MGTPAADEARACLVTGPDAPDSHLTTPRTRADARLPAARLEETRCEPGAPPVGSRSARPRCWSPRAARQPPRPSRRARRPRHPRPRRPPAAPARRRAPAADDIDLFTTGYAPADGQDGGTAIIGDWQEATQFNPFYLTQVTEANVAAATWATLVDPDRRLQVRARPRRLDPDHRQRRRQGPGRQRRRDDRHLEAARRPQVVRRRPTSPATTSGTRGSGSTIPTTRAS